MQVQEGKLVLDTSSSTAESSQPDQHLIKEAGTPDKGAEVIDPQTKEQSSDEAASQQTTTEN